MGEEGQVISCHTVDAWNQQIQNGKNKLIVVDFAASWCGPCRAIAPFVSELAKKMPHVIFLKVDVDELKEIASDWGVEAMPTFLLLKDGKTVAKVVGAKKEDLQQTINKHAGKHMRFLTWLHQKPVDKEQLLLVQVPTSKSNL